MIKGSPFAQHFTRTGTIFGMSKPIPASGSLGTNSFEEGVPVLPQYVRSLLKVRVPVVVTLATTQRPLNRILELSPGAIIQFSKPCDEPLTLSVGNREVAVGDAVKVGDKFGLRISSMVMPEERFWALRGKRDDGTAG
jgi:flagellar motor switch protein FliN/FliY